MALNFGGSKEFPVAKLTVREIQSLALEVVAANPGGIRYSVLIRDILTRHAETPRNTIVGAVWNLDARFPTKVMKPTRGLFVPAGLTDVTTTDRKAPRNETSPRQREEDFYRPFADWLKNELDEATIAVPLGGSAVQRKWGTPDVVGVYKPLASHRIKFGLEIIAAEVKVDPQSPVVAFGQAAAYRLFAAKSYVVMPNTVSEEDYSRLEALCMLFGIGLVLFELKVDNPEFVIRVRPQRFSPDMFYVNEFAERIHQMDAKVFDQLFG